MPKKLSSLATSAETTSTTIELRNLNRNEKQVPTRTPKGMLFGGFLLHETNQKAFLWVSWYKRNHTKTQEGEATGQKKKTHNCSEMWDEAGIINAQVGVRHLLETDLSWCNGYIGIEYGKVWVCCGASQPTTSP